MLQPHYEVFYYYYFYDSEVFFVEDEAPSLHRLILNYFLLEHNSLSQTGAI